MNIDTVFVLETLAANTAVVKGTFFARLRAVSSYDSGTIATQSRGLVSGGTISRSIDAVTIRGGVVGIFRASYVFLSLWFAGRGGDRATAIA